MTTAGTVELRVGRTRGGGSATAPLDRYTRRRPEIDDAMTQAYVGGVSTRDMATVTEALPDKRVGRSTVSRETRRLEDEVEALRRSPIVGPVPYLYLDATFVDARWARTVENVSALVAYGIGTDGHRHLLGVHIGASESEASWAELLAELVARGLGRAAHRARRARRAHRRGAEDPARRRRSSTARPIRCATCSRTCHSATRSDSRASWSPCCTPTASTPRSETCGASACASRSNSPRGRVPRTRLRRRHHSATRLGTMWTCPLSRQHQRTRYKKLLLGVLRSGLMSLTSHGSLASALAPTMRPMRCETAARAFAFARMQRSTSPAIGRDQKPARNSR